MAFPPTSARSSLLLGALSVLLGLAGCSSSDTATGTSTDAGTSSDASSGSDSAAGDASTKSASLSCDLTPFPQAPAGTIRAPTADEFALYVKTYTGQVYVNSTGASNAGPAVLAASGTLTMLDKSYAPTSYCLELIEGAPATGRTLYVHFTGGHADLWEKNSSYSGSLD